MGSNRRYADHFDRLADERILETLASKAPLQTLTAAELELQQVPLTIDPKPRRRVRAWVRFGNTPVRVEAVAVRWTPHAVGIEFQVAGTMQRCWVWEGAVEGLSEESGG